MLKNILKLDGAQELTKNEQKSIKGGLGCFTDGYCPVGNKCVVDCRYYYICKPNSYVTC